MLIATTARTGDYLPLARRTGLKATHAVFVALVLLALLGVSSTRGQDARASSITSADVTTEIGSDAEARSVLAAVLTHTMANRSKKEFFLASQIRDGWLPAVKGVEFVRLSDSDIAAHLEKCGYYWMISRVERAGNVVSLRLSQRCGGTSLHYVVSFDGREWRLGPPGTGKDGGGWVPGIGSGFVGRPLGCPCL